MEKLKYDELLEKYQDYTDSQKVTVLLNALSIMNGYNGYTEENTIVLAMGGQVSDIDDKHRYLS